MEREYMKGLERKQHLLELIGRAEERKLELRLGPPGDEDWVRGHEKTKVESKDAATFDLTFGCFSIVPKPFPNGAKHQKQLQMQQKPERKACGPLEAHEPQVDERNRTRSATTRTVGWPPVRSFRRNLVSIAKSYCETKGNDCNNEADVKNQKKGQFVKINMDGVPIGRKIDLDAYNCYENLALAVDQLFRGLLNAQKEPEMGKVREDQPVITGLLGGTGEYTLVYEDEEGDRMLVGDDPWQFFVSAAKRLRVLKSADLSASSLRTFSRKRAANEC